MVRTNLVFFYYFFFSILSIRRDSPLYGANKVRGLEHEDERDRIAQQYAGQEHVRHFPAGRLHDGRVVVFDEHGHHQQCDCYARGRQRHGPDCPAASGLQKHFRYFQTPLMVFVGPRAFGTDLAPGLVGGRTDLKTRMSRVRLDDISP